MAGRGRGLKQTQTSSSNNPKLLKAPPCTVASNGTSSRNAYVHSMMEILSGINANPGISRTDKTVCQYCGVSYLTMSEMKTLQTTVKEQEERLKHYKTMMEENNRLKEVLEESTRKYSIDETKRKEEGQRIKLLETQIEEFKRQLEESQGINLNLAEKYSIAADDSRQQEEVISSLRDQIQDLRDAHDENSILKSKLYGIEQNLKKFVSLNKNKNNEGDDQNNPQQILLGMFGDSLFAKTETTLAKTYLNNIEKKQDWLKQDPTEVGDLKRLNEFLSEKVRNIAEEHSNCQDMHAFLRETVDKLKVDNVTLHEQMSDVKIKLRETQLNLENSEATLAGIKTENERLKHTGNELEQKLNGALEQNKILKLSKNPKSIERLQNNIEALEKQINAQQVEFEQIKSNYEKTLAETQRETNMEKERADSCLRAIVVEREDVEKKWEERWSRHQTSLNQQLDTLKSTYENTVYTAKELEETLQKDLKQVKEQFDSSKDEWEAIQRILKDQINRLKIDRERQIAEFENIQKSKIEIEIILQNKNVELELLQEMVREGCEERQELQKKIQNLEDYIEEMRHGAAQKRSSMLFYQRMSSSSGPATADNSKESPTNNLSQINSVQSSKSESVLIPPLVKAGNATTLLKPALNSARNSSKYPSISNNYAHVKNPEPIQFTVGKGKVSFAPGGPTHIVSKDKNLKQQPAEVRKSLNKNTTTNTKSCSPLSRKSK